MGSSLLRRFADGPQGVFWLCLVSIVSAAWFALWHMGQSQFLSLICQPQPVESSSYPLVLFMWASMALAMMLPTAAPMLSTYLDISGAAKDKGVAIVSPYLLAIGYASVWLSVSIVAAAIQVNTFSLTDNRVAGILLVVAGLYQFSGLKQACLSKCRAPMSFFFANWTDRPFGVFQMGLTQGLYCLGCCWALMALAFVAGLMNVVWMAGLCVLMLLEKVLSQAKVLVYGTGAGLIAAGLALIWLN